MKKKLLKIGLSLIVTLVLALIGMVFFSPFTKKENQDYRSIDYAVEINAPVQTVFAYIGNSSNAEIWSSYVDHITPLNTAEFPDGDIGSIRRCFKNKNEEGIVWDEEILSVIPYEKRVLSVYNKKGFALSSKDLETEQIYETIDPNRTRLTFSLFFQGKQASWFERLKMHFASYTVYARFRDNLENIKRIIESKKPHLLE